MKVFITGGAGYVGSVLCQMLLENNYHVKVLDTLEFGGQGLLPLTKYKTFEFVNGSILDPSIIQNCIKDADAIIHLAAIVGYPACKKNPKIAQEINVIGTKNIVNFRNKDQKLLFASTGSIYGTVPNYICNEDTPKSPITLYGETKSIAEKDVIDAGNSVAYRFATAFGVSNRMRLDLMPNDFTFQAVKNKNLIVYERNFKRTFIHVRDMARSFLFALENWSKIKDDVYNVGHENMNFTKEQVAKKILEYTNFYLHFAEFGKDEDQRNYEVSYEKIRKKGFETIISLDQGIQELIVASKLINFNNPYSNV